MHHELMNVRKKQAISAIAATALLSIVMAWGALQFVASVVKLTSLQSDIKESQALTVKVLQWLVTTPWPVTVALLAGAALPLGWIIYRNHVSRFITDEVVRDSREAMEFVRGFRRSAFIKGALERAGPLIKSHAMCWKNIARIYQTAPDGNVDEATIIEWDNAIAQLNTLLASADYNYRQAFREEYVIAPSEARISLMDPPGLFSPDTGQPRLPQKNVNQVYYDYEDLRETLEKKANSLRRELAQIEQSIGLSA